jgi:hypothetical protein
LIREYTPEDVLIISHADHDGVSSSVFANLWFKLKFGRLAQTLFPSKTTGYSTVFGQALDSGCKCLLIFDSLVTRVGGYVAEAVKRGKVVINADHHTPITLESERFVDLNPQSYGIGSLCSSTVSWKICRHLEADYFTDRAWVPAVGTAHDYSFEGAPELFQLVKDQHPELINEVSFHGIFDSKLYEIARIVRCGLYHGERDHVYEKFVEAGESNRPKLLMQDALLSKLMNACESELGRTLEHFRRNHIQKGDLIFYEIPRGQSVLGVSVISDICERDRSAAAYIGFSPGIVTIRSLFGSIDARELAKHLGGGGPNAHSAGARTHLSFREVVELLSGSSRQACLTEFENS